MPRSRSDCGFGKTRHIHGRDKMVTAMIATQGYYDYIAGHKDGTDLNASAV